MEIFRRPDDHHGDRYYPKHCENARSELSYCGPHQDVSIPDAWHGNEIKPKAISIIVQRAFLVIFILKHFRNQVVVFFHNSKKYRKVCDVKYKYG